MSSYFKPIDVGGLQRFTQDGEAAGWYRLDMPEASAPPDVLPGITVPEGATGVLLQANTDLTYGFSPDRADEGIGDGLKLPAPGTHFVSGRTALAQLCILLPEDGADFTLQFYNGDIGPVPTNR